MEQTLTMEQAKKTTIGKTMQYLVHVVVVTLKN